MSMKKETRGKLVKKIDKVFSLYVRLRDSSDGYGRCITCNELKGVKESHAGHFISRGCMLTRWEETNVHLQCCSCNTYRFGEQAKYLIALESRYGRDEVDRLMELERKWKAGDHQKFTMADLRELLDNYKEKLKTQQS